MLQSARSVLSVATALHSCPRARLPLGGGVPQRAVRQATRRRSAPGPRAPRRPCRARVVPDAWAAREVGSWSVAAFDSCARRRLWRQVVDGMWTTGCGGRWTAAAAASTSRRCAGVASRTRTAWALERGRRARRRLAGDGVPRGRRRAAGVRRDRAHRAGRAALCFAERVPHVCGARYLR